jgi:hypothetical protein
MNDIPRIPVIQIRDQFLITYEIADYPTRAKKKTTRIEDNEQITTNKRDQLNEARKERYKGILSKGAIKRLRLAIDGLVAISDWKKAPHPKKNHTIKFKINFITLTLPAPQDKITDKEITNTSLKLFLMWMRRKYPAISYVWKAEAQENGNIHYHIASNQFIHWQEIRDEWNHQLKRHGLIKKFAAKHGHTNPNSTDIHSTRNIRDFAAYLIKYMSKNEEGKRKLDCKLWDCSDNLKTYKRPSTEITYQLSKDLTDYIKRNDTKIKNDDNFSIVFMTRKEWKVYLPPIVENTYQEWIAQIKNHYNQPPEEKEICAPF